MSIIRPAERIPVLMYHRVGEPLDGPDHRYCVRPADFARQMNELADYGYRAISMDAFLAWLEGAVLPDRAFVLTFDDGFRGVYEHAFPWLERAAWPCAVFLVSTLIGRRDAWNCKHAGGSSELLAREQILAMAKANVRFGSHTRTHAHLPQLSDGDLVTELRGSKAELEALLAEPVRYVAYPFGEADDRVISAVRSAGYALGFGCDPGFNRPGIDRYRIRRIDVYGTDTPRGLRRKIELGTNDGAMFGEIRYKARRLWQRVSPSHATN